VRTYSTTFDVGRGDESPLEILAEVRAKIAVWIDFGLNRHHGVHLRSMLSGDEQIELNDGTIQISNRVCDLGGGRGFQSIRYAVPDLESEGRFWVNRICLAWADEFEYSHEVEVVGYDAESGSESFKLRPPALIRELLTHFECKHAGIKLQIIKKMNHSSVGGLKKRILTNPARRWPVVVLTQKDGDAYDEEYWVCAKRLAGSAIVISSRDANATLALRAAIGAERTPHSGAIGIFSPGFTTDCDPAEVIRLMPWDVKKLRAGDVGLSQHLVNLMAWRMSSHPREGVLFQDLQSDWDEMKALHPKKVKIARYNPLVRFWKKLLMTFRPGASSRISELEYDLSFANQDLAATKAELEISRLAHARSKRDVERQIKSKFQENVRLEDRIAALNQQMGELRLRIRTLAESESSEQELQSEMADLLIEKAVLQADFKDLELKFRDASIELQVKSVEIEDLSDQIDADLRVINKFEDDLEEARGELQHHESLSEPDEKLIEDNRNLKSRLSIMELSRDEWKGRQQSAAFEARVRREPLEARIRELESENQSYRGVIHLSRTEDDQARKLESQVQKEYSTVLDALDAADEDKTVLTVFDDARKSANKSSYLDTMRIHDTLCTMANVAQDFLEMGAEGIPVKMSFDQLLRESGIDIELDDKDTAKRFPRDFGTKDEGGMRVTIQMLGHVKLGVGFNDHQHCARIYYLLYPEKETLLIGHCGRHPENRMTGKLS